MSGECLVVGAGAAGLAVVRIVSTVPKVHGARTLPQAPGVYFVGITVELAGLLREIGLEARAVGRAVADYRLAG